MNREDYLSHLEEIRTRVRLDLDPAAADFQLNLAKVQKHLEALIAYKQFVLQIPQILPTLTMTVEAFYAGTCHRGWAQHYIQQDLKTLEESWPAKP